MLAIRAATRTSDPAMPLREAVVGALDAVGWRPDTAPGGGHARERWEALAALVNLAEEVATAAAIPLPGADPAPATLAAFGEELTRRAALQHAPTVEGVTMASLHSAKGLEWDAVFLVGLAEGTLPTTYARTPEAVEEERRLLYVGVTRARQWLWLSYGAARSPGGRPRRPCRFLPALDPDAARAPVRATPVRSGQKPDGSRRRMVMVSCRVCGSALTGGVDRKLGRCATCPSTLDEELLERLHEWRLRVAAEQRVPAYVVFTDATMTALAERRPDRSEELAGIAGIGPRKLGLYGDAVLSLIAGAAVDDLAPKNVG
jgi:DNA helicase-2/ATP-dependent DNA helicase PcrA